MLISSYPILVHEIGLYGVRTPRLDLYFRRSVYWLIEWGRAIIASLEMIDSAKVGKNSSFHCGCVFAISQIF